MGHLKNYTYFEYGDCDENRISPLLAIKHSYWRYCRWYSDLKQLQEHFKVADRTYCQAAATQVRPLTHTWWSWHRPSLMNLPLASYSLVSCAAVVAKTECCCSGQVTASDSASCSSAARFSSGTV